MMQSLLCKLLPKSPHAERKRQWGALHRRLQKTDTLPAGVLAKWEAATSAAAKSGAHSTIS